MLEVKSKLKWYKKIPFVCVLVSIFVCLGSFVCSADVGQIGQGYTIVDGVKVYNTPIYDHGVPFDTIYSTLAYEDMIGTYGIGNSFIISDVGLTYAPDQSSYSVDQYPRTEALVNFTNLQPYPSASFPFMYSWYSYLSAVSGTPWNNDVVTYTYLSYPNGLNASLALNAMNGNVENSVLYASQRINGSDLISSSSYVASTVNFRSYEDVSVDLISSGTSSLSYYPNYISTYCLVPLDYIGLSPYCKVNFSGYYIGYDGVMNESTFYFNSETTPDLLAYCDYDYVADEYYPSSIQRNTTDYLAYYYEECYGLLPYYCDFDIDQFVRDYCAANYIDVLTYIDVSFGLEVHTMNSKINDFYDVTGSYPICGSSVTYHSVSPYTMSHHADAVYDYLKNHVADIPVPSDFSLEWLGTTVADVMSVNLFGSFGIGDILITVLSIVIVVSFLKIFAGG